jgi:hypothetical protein
VLLLATLLLGTAEVLRDNTAQTFLPRLFPTTALSVQTGASPAPSKWRTPSSDRHSAVPFLRCRSSSRSQSTPYRSPRPPV